jgi:hypothetical protein
MTFMPYFTIAVLPTPLIAALIPGQSPPAVKMPILFGTVFLPMFSRGIMLFNYDQMY